MDEFKYLVVVYGINDHTEQSFGMLMCVCPTLCVRATYGRLGIEVYK